MPPTLQKGPQNRGPGMTFRGVCRSASRKRRSAFGPRQADPNAHGALPVELAFVKNYAPTPAKHTLPEKSPSASHPMAPLRRFRAQSGDQVAESASRCHPKTSPKSSKNTSFRTASTPMPPRVPETSKMESPGTQKVQFVKNIDIMVDPSLKKHKTLFGQIMVFC